MDFFEVVKNRCSVRVYQKKAIPREDLEKIIDAARYAPTARGEEPWEFIVVTQEKMLVKLADITDHGKFLSAAAAAIIVVARDTKYYLEDGCAATQNILLAARALGVGSCWIAGDKKGYAEKILLSLDVPAGYKLVSIIALGYPQAGFIPHQKRRLAQLLHWDKF